MDGLKSFSCKETTDSWPKNASSHRNDLSFGVSNFPPNQKHSCPRSCSKTFPHFDASSETPSVHEIWLI